jgi:uncharacterized protein YkwD
MEKTFTPAFFILLIVAFSFFQTTCTKEDHDDNGDNHDPTLALENEALSLINAHRTSQELATLQSNAVIKQQASQHCTDMADGTAAFVHDGSLDRVAAIKASIHGTYTAENVAMDGPSADATVTAWLNSPSHKANIEGDFNLTGMGALKASNGTTYYTQIFFKSSR